MRARKTTRGGGRKPARRAIKRAAGGRKISARSGAGRRRAKTGATAAKRVRTVRTSKTARSARTAGRSHTIARSAGARSKGTGSAAARAGAVRAPRASARPESSSPRMQNLAAMLARKGAEILEQIKRARAATVDTDRTSFAEVGDLVSASVEKEKAFEYGEAGVNALREIKSALQKLKEGTYGKCERCGKPIGVKRLEVMPSARLCVKCKLKEESSGKTVPPSADNVFED